MHERSFNFEIPDNPEHISEVTTPYYLFDFSNHDLMEVVSKPDHYSEFDIDLAVWLLKERGREVAPAELRLAHINQIKDVPQVGKLSKSWIYITSIFKMFVGSQRPYST